MRGSQRFVEGGSSLDRPPGCKGNAECRGDAYGRSAPDDQRPDGVRRLLGGSTGNEADLARQRPLIEQLQGVAVEPQCLGHGYFIPTLRTSDLWANPRAPDAS